MKNTLNARTSLISNQNLLMVNFTCLYSYMSSFYCVLYDLFLGPQKHPHRATQISREHTSSWFSLQIISQLNFFKTLYFLSLLLKQYFQQLFLSPSLHLPTWWVCFYGIISWFSVCDPKQKKWRWEKRVWWASIRDSTDGNQQNPLLSGSVEASSSSTVFPWPASIHRLIYLENCWRVSSVEKNFLEKPASS